MVANGGTAPAQPCVDHIVAPTATIFLGCPLPCAAIKIKKCPGTPGWSQQGAGRHHSRTGARGRTAPATRGPHRGANYHRSSQMATAEQNIQNYMQSIQNMAKYSE
ncbi:unnamed protein product [Prorocentrum cordatum]|uniref:Uncharacterized protein n=1 Tax=Prorocentrum cordatum TaxID=2364126 RepID=A0ABN9UB95_9DINO|nr:unnamed protein product [Polarella glacialis]